MDATFAHADKRLLDDGDDVCGVCNVRKKVRATSTCFHFQCRRKGRAHYLPQSAKVPPQEVDGVEQYCRPVNSYGDDVGKGEPVKCKYCESRPAIQGQTTCFDDRCIKKQQSENRAPPRIHVTTVADDSDNSESDNNSSERDDGSVVSYASDTSYNASSDSDVPSYTLGDEESAAEESVSGDESLHSATTGSDINNGQDSLVGSLGSSDDSDETSISLMCENCHRHGIFENVTGMDVTRLPYYFEVGLVEKDSVRFHRKFCSMSKRTYENEETVPLCTHCEVYLTETGSEAQDMEVQFPGYIWSLQSKTLRALHREREILWRIMPRVWRLWWQVAFDIDDVNTPPGVQTETIDVQKRRFASGTSGDIKRLVDTFDELLMPLVLCPWGCTEYYHKCGDIPFDVILQQHFQHLDLVPLLSPRTKLCMALTSRLDFIRDSLNCPS